MTTIIDRCRSTLRSAARCFRLGCDGQGHDCLIGFVDRMSDLLGGELPEDRAARLASIFPLIIDAQTRGDTIAIADLLEHEVDPLLG